MFAFALAFLGPIGTWEFALLVAVGLLLFGKQLPEVGKQIGKGIVEFKRGLNQLKRQISDDAALRDARSALNDLKREVDAPRELLRNVQDPVRMFENLTNSDQATPSSAAQVEPPPAGSFLPTPPPPQ